MVQPQGQSCPAENPRADRQTSRESGNLGLGRIWALSEVGGVPVLPSVTKGWISLVLPELPLHHTIESRPHSTDFDLSTVQPNTSKPGLYIRASGVPAASHICLLGT